jgi:hypothetical protein
MRKKISLIGATLILLPIGFCVSCLLAHQNPREMYLNRMGSYAAKDALIGEWMFRGYLAQGKSIRPEDTCRIALSSDKSFVALIQVWTQSVYCEGSWEDLGGGKIELSYSKDCHTNLFAELRRVDLNSADNVFVKQDQRIKATEPPGITNPSTGDAATSNNPS